MIDLSPFDAPPSAPDGAELVDLGGRVAYDFAAERTRPDQNLFDAVVAHIKEADRAEKNVLVTAASEGSLERLRLVLADHGLDDVVRIHAWAELKTKERPALAVLPLDHGFATDGCIVLSETDIFGERLSRPAKKKRRSDQFIPEVASLSEGDVVVHNDHGIGRFEGLVTLELGGAPHDCLKLSYHGGDRLFVPVENLDVLSRYGSSDGVVQLDKLGGLGWQQRKARVKKRIQEIAGELIELAARRATRKGEAIDKPVGLYEEFAARFVYQETEDQERAIEQVLEDLASGQPMDRLVCGDVGFGKTEVALRAAFVTAMAGRQVAILAPTTLLARQHYQVLRERFSGLPVKVAQLSRFVTPREASQVRDGLAEGKIDIVVGTHALLGPKVQFKNLGLVVIDEEQHFGVVHKERLKKLRAEVHVLTMTATPIPRTLQMALGGLKELSLIATPPVDRLAVRAFVLPGRPGGHPRGHPARALPGRADLLCLPARRGPGKARRPAQDPGAGDQGRRRQRTHGGEAPRRGHGGLLRPQDRPSPVHQHHRVGSRHPERQHPDRASRRHVRPLPALPAQRPGRPQQGARLRLFHPAAETPPARGGGAQAVGHPEPGSTGRRLPARLPRPRHSRRRQSPRRRAVRPYQGSRLRALQSPPGRGGATRQAAR